jgi:hypothetical protein
MDRGRVAALLTVGAALASALGLAACTGSSTQTTCLPATPRSAMATHGSLQVRELRRAVVTIITSTNTELERLAPGPPGSNISTSQAANLISLMATRLTMLHYPSHYHSAEKAMVTTTQSLAESLRSGQAGTKSSNALIAAVTASQQFYGLLGIPERCTTTSS